MIKFFSFLLLLVLTSTSFAVGTLFVRPLGSSSAYDQMWIKSMDATADVNGQVAVTFVDQTFRNEMNTTVEAVWIFPLPENAVVVELYYWFNGQRYKGSVRERAEAREAYEGQIRRNLDPALLEEMGDNLYRLSIAPINRNSDVRTEITYVEMLPYEFGTVDYEFGLNTVGMSPKALQRISFQGTFQSTAAYKTFTSPSHATSTAISITKVNNKKYSVVFGDENFLPEKNLRIQFETLRESVQMDVLRYTPVATDSIGTESYYAVWITPPDSLSPDQQIPKKIVFTADVSSSMEGTRIQQLKESLNAFLDNLQYGDWFNIITFGTSVEKFKNDLVEATPALIEEAREFVTQITALGLTNINQAMLQSLAQSFSDEFANMIVFMTDGYPTWGETFVPNILENVQNANDKNVRIFSFGVGENVSEVLLVKMANDNGGYSEFITQDDNIEWVIANHFRRISKPALTDLNIDIEGLTAFDKFPRTLPDLFWGSQVMELGMYSNSGTFPVNLKGDVAGKDFTLTDYKDFPGTAGGHRFIPRLWARAKINYLLDEISVYGELDELVNQVIELSLRYQILTPYTAFYADPNDPTKVADEQIVPENFELHQNYPNPFNPTTTISFELPQAGLVVLKIYDLTGRLVKVLLNATQQAGSHTILWDATDEHGKKVAAGVYLYQLTYTTANGEQMVLHRKMSLVK